MRWFEATDGGPTLLAYGLGAVLSVMAAVTVVLVVMHYQRRDIRRNTLELCAVRDELTGVECFVTDVQGALKAAAPSGEFPPLGRRPRLTVVRDD